MPRAWAHAPADANEPVAPTTRSNYAAATSRLDARGLQTEGGEIHVAGERRVVDDTSSDGVGVVMRLAE